MMFDKFISLISVLLLLIILANPTNAQPVIGTWRGYVYMSGSIAADGVYVTAHLNNGSAVATTIIGGGEYAPDAPSGYYSLDVQCTGGKVNFKVCGILVPLPAEDCTSGPHYNGTEPNFNLSVTKLSDGASCSYSCACAGGYCCSGATEYTAGEGTGTCQSSACVAATTTTTVAPGAEVTTTTTTVTTTTTTLPPLEETIVVESIAAGATGIFEFTKPNLVVTEIAVTTTATVTLPSLTVSQSSTAPATVAVAAPHIVYSYLTVTKSNITDEAVSEVKIKFKLTKTWIADNNINEATVALQRYAAGEWIKLPTSKVNEDASYSYFEATSTALSVFAITAERLVPTTTTTVTTTLPTTTTLPVVAPVAPTLLIVIIAVIAIVAFLVWRYKRSMIFGRKFGMRRF